jgi:ATP-dependent DNA helicase RecQ
MSGSNTAWSLDELRAVIARHWGFRELRPLQEQAMRAVLDGRDSLVAMPTGGGKSLCYQAPAVYRGGTTVVVSPLIALMKDQVDALRACGVAATQLDSSLSGAERSAYEMDLRQGELRLLFLSPERLVSTDIYRILQQIDVRTFAIDEAHCISHWGHDFRPEYRQLNRLRDFFPDAAIHAYTATATEQVRQDIIAQLGMRDPAVLVGNFDRPNLTYRVLARHDMLRQVLDVLDRHRGEAGIIYCPRRRDVDDLAAALKEKKFSVLPYHAGMTSEQRHEAQEAFRSERVDVIVATVAFGMGIDRSNVRFVLHTAIPKSLEHYQQETGRAGRDGLEAECVLLHSGGDFLQWKWVLEKSAQEPGVDPAFLPGALRHLQDMDRYSRGAVCRHKALAEYFGQTYPAATCNACDLCLGDTEEVAGAAVIAQKVLSCVARVKERFGVGHVVAVLRGQNTDNVRKRQHDQLTTFGLLKEHSQADVRDWVYQLLGQGVLVQAGEEYPVLQLNPASWEVLRGQRTVRLVQPVRRKKGEAPKKSQADATSWEGVDRDLFEALRVVRREFASARQVSPFIIFNDATLREMARVRPSTPERLRMIPGVSDKRLSDYGARFLVAIKDHCQRNGLSLDNSSAASAGPAPPQISARHTPVFQLFRKQASIEDVMRQMNYQCSTALGYLRDYILTEKPASIETWVPRAVYQRVQEAARQVGMQRLKPIYLALGEQVSYDDIRLVVAHLQGHTEHAN